MSPFSKTTYWIHLRITHSATAVKFIIHLYRPTCSNYVCILFVSLAADQSRVMQDQMQMQMQMQMPQDPSKAFKVCANYFCRVA